MKARRFTSRGTAEQAARRAAWAEYLESGAWQARRLAFFLSGKADTECPGCDTPMGLSDDVHHLEYPKVPGEEADEDLVVLCRPCHEAVHGSLDGFASWRRMTRRAATWAILEQLHRRSTA